MRNHCTLCIYSAAFHVIFALTSEKTLPQQVVALLELGNMDMEHHWHTFGDVFLANFSLFNSCLGQWEDGDASVEDRTVVVALFWFPPTPDEDTWLLKFVYMLFGTWQLISSRFIQTFCTQKLKQSWVHRFEPILVDLFGTSTSWIVSFLILKA